MGEAYWAFREDDEYVLCVEEKVVEPVRRELEACRRKRRKRAPARKLKARPVRLFPFVIYGGVLAVIYWLQHLRIPLWSLRAGPTRS